MVTLHQRDISRESTSMVVDANEIPANVCCVCFDQFGVDENDIDDKKVNSNSCNKHIIANYVAM